ncbi:MAG: heparinase II/III family protein, partial [Pseudomonadota bacterium]
RVSHWLSQYGFYEPALDGRRQIELMTALGRQTRHLMRNLPADSEPDTQGAGEIVALKGWVLGALCLDPEGLKLDQALAVMGQRLAAQIAPDGGYITRNPSDQLGVVRDLIDVRAALVAAGYPVPQAVQDAIDRTIPALRLFRHGDGGLATMNGGLAADPLVIDTALAQTDARGRPLRSLVETGYERVSIGRTAVIIDTAGAPPKPYDRHAHAGLFGFEMSHGRERIIISCGHDPTGGALTHPLRSTAASSTLVVADTNASAVSEGGGIEREPGRIASTRETGSYGTRVAMSHDGWLPRFGLTYDRIITVSESGEAVFGEERLHGQAGHRFAIRFHVAPDIQVSPIQGGALLKPLSGTGWRFQCPGASLEVEESIYLGDGAPRRCYQLVLTGETEDHSASALKGDRRIGANLGWSLTRERKPARLPTNHQSLTL